MQDAPIEVRRGTLCLSTDRRASIAPPCSLCFAGPPGRFAHTRDTRSGIENSICFAVFDGQTLIVSRAPLPTSLRTLTDGLASPSAIANEERRWLSETCFPIPNSRGFDESAW